MFDPDPQSGLGTWGEEPDDFTLHDGGLSSFSLSYPIPHILRRNYTLQPWFAFPLPHLIPDPALLANSTFAKSEISHTVNNFVGDFSALQLSIERFQVRGFLRTLSLVKLNNRGFRVITSLVMV